MRTAPLLALFALLASVFVAAPAFAQNPPAFVWLEGEAASAVNVPEKFVTRAGWGHKELLSGDTWFQVGIDENNAEKEIPDSGVIVRYDFTAEKSGDYEIWDRLGYEFVRSPFQWRVDNGTWATVAPTQLTSDLMAMDTWVEVAWLSLGKATLAPGKHTIEIKIDKTKNKDGKFDRVLYASDALCLINGAFAPNGKYKPGDLGRTEADVAAEKNLFNLAEAKSDGSRIALALAGNWEIARADEQLPPANIAVPMEAPKTNAVYRAIPVPSDKNVARPDLTFAHRVWYRTKINVPATHSGRGFTLTFPRNNLNTTVYVNGVFCGFNKNPNAPFTIDVTKGIKPGQVNTVYVGIRDAWYGYSNSPKDPMKLRKMFNIPLSFVGNGFQDLAYPIWHAWESGIVQTPVLQSVGSVYASDVFVKSDVAHQRLAGEALVTNTTALPFESVISFLVIDAKTNKAVDGWGYNLTLAPHKSKVVTFDEEATNLKFWWPQPNPQLYFLRISIGVKDAIVDSNYITFGFREWGSRGKDFTLNGMVWHGWADLCAGDTPEDFLKNYRAANERFMRLAGHAQGGPTWNGLTPGDALDFFDKNGVVVRRSGDLDGEAIGYNAIENDPVLRDLYKSDIKMDLMQNWRDQMVQQVIAERNHPSIHVWSIENEWLYINCINLYADKLDTFEAESKKTLDAVMAADPTRLAMTDGGGSGKGNIFPIHGDHYVFDSGRPGAYPALAYEQNPDGGGRGRWHYDGLRPRYMGEDYFASGINPADYAPFGGEETFIGNANTRKAKAKVQRMLTEGYRWAEFGAYHFWLGTEGPAEQYAAFPDLAVFVREWDSTFSDGKTVTRNCGIFNDQFTDSDDPITFKAVLTVGGKSTVTDTKTFTVARGTNKKFTTTFVPSIVGNKRVSGTWTITLTQEGKEKFRDVRPVTILPTRSLLPDFASGRGATTSYGVTLYPERITPGTSAGAKTDFALHFSFGGKEGKKAGIIPLVYDPNGSVIAYLHGLSVPFNAVKTLDNLPKDALLIVGRDALNAEDAASTKLAAFASSGRRVVVLEQTNPLKYQALPAIMEPATNEGRIAFIEDENHPVFDGLQNSDFFTFANGEVVYRNAYEKPTSGAKSLLQCDNRLSRTAIAEVPAGSGLILLCQVNVGANLGKNAVANKLFDNLVMYAASYKREYRSVVVVTSGNSATIAAMKAAGVQFSESTDILKAISGRNSIAVLAATPENLKFLAINKAALDKFNDAGGFLFLTDLTPEGLTDYNKVVGFDHMIRPFRRERVTFAAKRDPLTAGLSNGDIVLSSGERINGFNDDMYLAADVFKFIVDFDDVAPFATLPEPSYWGNGDAGNDHNPYNIVNGFNSTDSWKLIFSMWAGQGAKTQIPMSFLKPQTITEVEWQGNTFYYPTKQFELIGDGASKAIFNPAPNNEVQTFPINPPVVGKEIMVKITGVVPAKEPSIVGIDNIRLKAKRDAAFYKTVHPLLNIGALMHYDRGGSADSPKGGIVLCNVNFLDTEAVPENKRKKQNILATILRNLKAPVGGAASIIAGASLAYSPVDIGKFATQFRNEQGWFGDKAFTFAALPTGKQNFGGVPFDVYQFATSPVPNAIMLKGDGVPGNLPDAVRGIPVGKKADALFFLHTARIDQRRNNDEIRDKKKFEMARYIVTYTDGQKATVPVYAEIDIDDYKQEGTPRSLPGAQIGWTKKYDGTPYSAVAYVMQWNNPRPGVVIQSVDMEYGNDKRGVPVLLAVTAASTVK